MWKRIICDSSVPPPRSSHSVTAIGQKVYVFSGEKEPRVPINNQLRCFDLIKQCWSEVSAKGQLPPPRVGHGAAAIGSKLYVFGGRSSIEMGEGLISDLHCFDTQTGEWSLVRHFSSFLLQSCIEAWIDWIWHLNLIVQ